MAPAPSKQSIFYNKNWPLVSPLEGENAKTRQCIHCNKRHYYKDGYKYITHYTSGNCKTSDGEQACPAQVIVDANNIKGEKRPNVVAVEVDEEEDGARIEGSAPKKSKITSFVDTITPQTKEKIDTSLARFVYSSASPFQIVENKYFIEAWKLGRPAYQLPSAARIGGELLNKEYDRDFNVIQELIKESNNIVIVS
jgi:hypothetical protein